VKAINQHKFKDIVCIEAKPAIVDRLPRIDDWEDDTIIGLVRQSALLSMVKRKTLYTVIVKLVDKRAEPLATALINRMEKAKGQIKRSRLITVMNLLIESGG
jgi:IS30 family transposase